MGGMGPLLGAGAGAGAQSVARFSTTQAGRELLPYLAALSSAQVLPMSMPGLGAALGTFGLSRMLARRALPRTLSQKQVRGVGEAARKGVEFGSRATMAGVDTLQRRRLEP